MNTTGYTVAQLREALTFAKTHPEGTLHIAWAPWNHNTFSGAEWRRWFRQSLMTKINRQQPTCRGRKDTPEWFLEQWRASRELNTPRLVIHWLPRNLKARFAHRLRASRHDL